MGTLYIVATPIGNLQDITLRAINILKSVDAIACEDTRKTGLLLQHIMTLNTADTTNIANNSKRPRLVSYYEQNELKRIPEITSALKDNLNIALVSDAGTPGISDPGFKLIRECIRQGIKVESIPGPTSAISALVSSGLPTDKFLFLGYLPRKPGHRKKLLKDTTLLLDSIRVTVIIFEAPHKILRTLLEMKEIFGDTEIVIARELTKVYEEVRREKISISIEHFNKTTPKGELVILFNLNS